MLTVSKVCVKSQILIGYTKNMVPARREVVGSLMVRGLFLKSRP